MHFPRPLPYLISLLVVWLCYSQAQGQSVLIRQEQHRLPFIKDSISQVNSLNRIGMLYHLKNPDSCFYYGMKAKTIAIRLHYRKGVTDADNVIATALFLRGLSRESLQLFSTVLHDYQQESDTANIAQALMNMATVYASITDTTQAKILSRRAIQTGRNLKQDSIMSLVYANYCMLNGALSDDSVRYYLDKSQKIALRYKDQRMLIAILQIRAGMLLNKNLKKEALPLIIRSLSEARNAGMEYLQANSLELYAAYYSDKPDSVRSYYDRIYQLAQEKGYIFLRVPVLKVVLTYTEMAGNKDKIIAVHRLLEAALTAENENQKKFIGDYIKYNAIQDDNILLETNNKNNKTEIFLLITGCLVSIMLIIFIYRLYKLSRHLNKQISEQNSNMQKTLIDLEQSQADNTRMMQIAAHDLRNPIGGITSIAALMLDDDDRSTEDRMMLELIKTSGQNSLELVSDLLQVHTKVEELKKEHVDLSLMLHYCVGLMHYKAEAKGQQLKLHTTPVTLSVNREKLWRVISNLIANAIKFSPSGADIYVDVQELNGRVLITVEDHGIGIPIEMKDKIFDMFTEAKRAGTAGEQPFGLGLAISKQIVEAHGGRIWFESKSGNGTTFFVELPIL
ncbi:His Kinase A (phospho-acceptor) domain-containing protein [Mucilaginibacter mallensis]|uniref:histidine kinase n=1 Tax=Mucilaginibacter mallensis TaxID=652787 RepID=A0A1H2CF90_MUCMA|nr:HAMP domain-containing sensor histidine kinase [Mucilaginibacter mallensis]SDT69121.1 His Kinase A (phospho-acceptor) domain-containing protein [Mucilaginibacter mallensis]